MNNKLSKTKEFSHFSTIADEWWLQNGKFKILHDIIPLRIEYIINKINRDNLDKIEILDLGCGGGLTCEPLARLKANVTGIDFIEQNIKIAKDHARISKLKIDYIHDDLDSLNIKKKYDVVLLLEVLEHLENWKVFITKIKRILKPQGILIISTINKTKLSNFFAIFVAENILNWVPKNTHDFNKLISPKELSKELAKSRFKILDISGMNYNPFLRQWKLIRNFYPINYFCTATLK